jgi:hypothetical protein
MFGGQNVILIFYATYAEDKKLSRCSAEDKNFSFCPVSGLPVCPIQETVLNSNTIQLKLSCPIHYFLAHQTHPNTTSLCFPSDFCSIYFFSKHMLK